MNPTEHLFNSSIWNINIDQSQDLLWLELRDTLQKKCTFTAVDLQQQRIVSENITTEESWFCGTEATDKGIALLHYYKNAGSPEHLGLIAVDMQTGTTLWKNYQLTFKSYENGIITAKNTKIESNIYEYLALETGSVIPNPQKTEPNTHHFIIHPIRSSERTEFQKNYDHIHTVWTVKYTTQDIHIVIATQQNTTYLSFYTTNNKDNTTLLIQTPFNSDLQSCPAFLYKNYLIYTCLPYKLGYFKLSF